MIQVKARKRVAVAQRRVLVAVEFIREIHHTFASIVEFQPDLVIMKIARLYNMPGCVLISGQLVPLFRDVDKCCCNVRWENGARGWVRAPPRSTYCFGCTINFHAALADTFVGPFGTATLIFHTKSFAPSLSRPVWVVAGLR